jgi:hypothetical protein
MRRILLALSIAVAAGGALTAPAVAACPWTAKLSAPTHSPKVGKPWKIRVTTSLANVRSSAYYAFLFKGKQVSRQEINPDTFATGHALYHFRGGFRDPTIVWPKRALGIPLTFRVVIKNRCGTKNLDYDVKVRR